MLTAKQIIDREPELGDGVTAGIFIPGEHVIDPWTTPYVYLLDAISHGATLKRNCEILGAERNNDDWLLSTNIGQLNASVVVNCAGLYGDLVDQILNGDSRITVTPRKGQFLVYDKSAHALVRSIILPVPTDLTKGVIVAPTIFGNLLVGPTAEPQQSRTDRSVDQAALGKLKQQGERMLPGLSSHSVTALYAGLRPATEFKDYCIEYDDRLQYVLVGGIRSTGLTGALGIAEYVFEKIHGAATPRLAGDKPLPDFHQIAITEKRDWEKPGNDGIICHCEWVTQREISDALQGPLAAASLDGLKRRTRVTMGRCQGFHCSAKLLQLTKGRLHNNNGSNGHS